MHKFKTFEAADRFCARSATLKDRQDVVIEIGGTTWEESYLALLDDGATEEEAEARAVDATYWYVADLDGAPIL